MACYTSWNGQPSVLAQLLTEKYGEDITNQVMSKINSIEFEADFGTYKGTEAPSMPVDELAKEPTLEWVEKTMNLTTIDAQKKEQGDITQMKHLTISKPSTKTRKNDVDDAHRSKVLEAVTKEIINVAKATPNEQFVVGYKNPWENKFADDNGFTEGDYAQMFMDIYYKGGLPINLHFYPAFLGVMANNIKPELQNLIKDVKQLWNIDENLNKELTAKVEIPVVDTNEVTTDFVSNLYGSSFQVDAVDMVSTMFYKQINALKGDNTLNPYTIIRQGLNSIKNTIFKLKTHPEYNTKKAQFDPLINKLETVVNSFAFPATDTRISFLSLSLKKLEQLGFNLKQADRNKLLNKFTEEKKLHPVKDASTLDLEFENNKIIQSNDDVEASDDTAEASISRGEGISDWSKISFETDVRDTASTRLKMWLSSLEEQENFVTDNDGNITGTSLKRNSLGMPKTVNIDDVLNKILGLTASVYDLNLDKAVQLLEDSMDPTLWKTAQILKSSSIRIQNEFIKVSSLQYGTWKQVNSQLKEDSNGQEFLQTRIIDSQKSGAIGETIRLWQQMSVLSPMMKVRSDNSRVLDVVKAGQQNKFFTFYGKLRDRTRKEDLKKEFESIKNSIASVYDGSFEDLWNDEYNPVKEKVGDKTVLVKRKLIGTILQKAFSEYNITLDDSTVKDITGKFFDRKNKVSVDNIQSATGKGDWFSHFEFTDAGEPMGVFSAFFGQASATLQKKFEDSDEVITEEDEDLIMENNPLYLQTTTMKYLARVFQKHNPQLNVSMFKNIEGKKIYSYSLNTSLSKAVQELKDDFDSFYKKFADTILLSDNGTTNAKASFILRSLNDKKNFDKFGLTYLNGLQHNSSNKGTVRSGMSDREQLLTAVNLYLNNGNATANYLSLTHSDKTMTPMFYGVQKLNVGNDIVDTSIPPNVIDEFYFIFEGELRRIEEHRNVKDYNDSRYNKGGAHFYFLPFNHNDLSKADQELLYTESKEFRPITQEMKSRIKQLIDQHLKEQISINEGKFTENGIDYRYLDRKWTKKVQDKLDQSGTKLSTLIKANKTEEIEERNSQALKYAIKSFTINSMLWNINSSMIFYGDPALTWKKSVPDTLKEYAKRLAKDIAPGQDLHWAENKKQYRALTLADSEQTASGVHSYLKTMGSNVDKFNATDAQEFTTVQEHLDVMMAAGLIEDTLYDELTSVIRKGVQTSGYYEFTPEQVQRMMQPMQPMKPVVAGFSRQLHGVLFYDYVKSSTYPLLPQFTKGTEMDKLRKAMEGSTGNDIQRANFESAKKIGAPKNLLPFKEDGNSWNAQQILEATQTLDRKNFRIQQDVPYDEEKDAIGIVSQMNKLIVEGIQDLNGFKIGTLEMNGKKVRAFKETIRVKMIEKGYNALMEKLGAIPNDKGEMVPNKGKFIALLIDEATSRGYSENDISLLRTMENGDFDFPLFLHPAIEKFESLVMSLVKKITEFKIPGKSYVQVSSAGYSKVKTEDKIDKSEIVFVGDHDGSKPLLHARVIDGVFYPAQVYAPFNFQYEIKGKTVIASVDDFLLKEGDEGYEANRKKLNTAKVPKELLELVGARIPNQGHNSMLPIEIVGFVPALMGDALFVPSPITGQMGSDFDVDKLYTYKRPYKYNHFNSEFIPEGFNEDPTTKEELQRAYFDVHWGVLSHPEMINRIVSKLDLPDLVEANKTYSTEGNGMSYWNSMAQLDQFQAGKDAKALVGLTSLAVTFNSVIQDKSLVLGTYVYNPDTKEMEEVASNLKVNGLKLTTLNGYGSNGNNTKHLNHTIYQSAAVDNAKDRTLDNLNISIYTYPGIQALHQLQDKDRQIVNPDFTIAMTVQEVMWEFSKEMRKGNDSLSTEFQKDLQASVIDKLKGKYINEIQSKFDKEYKESPVELTTELLNTIWKEGQKGDKSEAYYHTQLKVLEVFEELLKIGKRLGELQKTLNQDTKGAGPNVLYARQQLENFDGMFKKHSMKVFIGEDSLADGYEQSGIFKAVIPVADMLGEFLIPRDLTDSIFNDVAKFSGTQLTEMSISQQREIIRQLRASILSSSPILGTDITEERKRLLFDSNLSKSLAKRVLEYKLTNKDNYFINRLQTSIDSTGLGVDTVTYENAKAVRMDDALNVADFTKLLTSAIVSERELAQDLVKYALLLNPQNGPNSFVGKVPVSLLLSTSYSSDMRNSVTSLNSKNFLKQLHQHVPSLALELSEDNLKFNDPINSLPGTNYPEVITVNADGNDFEKYINLGVDTRNETIIYAPFLRFFSKKEQKTVLYELTTAGDGTYIQYNRIDTLGNKNLSEYNNNNENVRSIIQKNRANTTFKLSSNFIQNSVQAQVDKVIEKTSNSENQYANWGLEDEGGEANIQEALANIENDRRLPAYLQTLSSVYKRSNIGTISDRMITEYTGRESNPELKVVIGNFDYNGNYDSVNKKLELNITTNPLLAAETLLHEYIHAQTSGIIAVMGYQSRTKFKSEDAYKSYLKKAEEFQRKNPDVYNTVKSLDRLRYDVLQKYTKQLEESGRDSSQMLKDVQSNQLLTDEHKILYALSSVSEFVSHVMTNREVMQFLNEIETTPTEKSFIDKIIDALLNLFEEVAKFIGTSVKENSVLREAYSLSYGLTQLEQIENLDMFGIDLMPKVLKVENIQKAERYQSIVESTYHKKTEIKNNGLQYELHISDRSNMVSIPKEVAIVLEKMTNQLQHLDAILGMNPKTEEEKKRYVIAEKLHAEILADKNNLQATKDLLQLRELGENQLKWVKKILVSDTPHIQEVIMATTLLDLWTGLDVLYQDELAIENSEFRKIKSELEDEAKSFRPRIKAFTIKALKSIAQQKGTSELTLDDLGINLKDQNLATQFAITLSRNGNKAIQLFTTVGQEAANNVNEATNDLRVQLLKVEQDVKQYASANGLTPEKVYEKFISKTPNSVSLVSALGPEWNDHNSTIIKELRDAIQTADRTFKDNKKKTEYKKKAFDKFWTNAQKKGVMLDLNKLLDPATGEFSANVEAYIQELTELSGEESVVRSIADKAKKSYTRFLSKKKEHLEWLENNIEPKENESKEDAITRRMKYWETLNSPLEFSRTMNTNSPDSVFAHSSYYTAWFIPKKGTELLDKNYEEIQSNEKLKELYETFKGLSKRFKSYLPPSIVEEMDENFLPLITQQAVAEGFNLYKDLSLNRVTQKIFGAISLSEAQKLEKNFEGIQLKHTSNKGSKEDVEKASVDIPKLLEMFGNMAIHYNYMQPVLQFSTVLLDVLRLEDSTRTKEKEEGLSKLIESVEYYRDMLVYKKAKKHEGVSDDAVYSLNPFKNASIKKRIVELNTEIEVLKEKIDNDPNASILADEATETPDQKRLRELEKELKEITKDARYFTASKVADTIIGINQLKAMSYNPFSGISNFTFGLMSGFIHGRGFRADKETGYTSGDYTVQQYRQALQLMKGNYARSWGSITGYTGTVTAKKIKNILDRTGMIDSFIDTNYGKTNLSAADRSALRKTIDPMAWQKTGDFVAKGAVVIAMALNKEVQVEVNGEKKTINLFDALNEEGNWDEAQFGVNTDWTSTEKDDQVLWNKWRDRARKVGLLVFGNQDSNSPLLLRKFMFGRLIGQFRASWVSEGVNTRFGKQYYDEQLERTVEGRYRTAWRVGRQTLPIMLKQIGSAFSSSINPFEGVQTEQEIEVGGEKRKVLKDIQEFEIENMRRNLAGIMYTLSVAAAIFLLRNAFGDDDDDEEIKAYRNLALNILVRTRQDLTFYSSPSTAEQLMGNIVPSMSVINDARKAVGAVSVLWAEDPDYKKAAMKVMKAFPIANNIPKLDWMMHRDISAAVR